MKTPGKKVRLGQPVKQVTVDASLLPKTINRKPAADSGATAKVNIVAPVHPAVSATRQKIKQQALKTTISRVGAAIEAGSLPAAEAKRLLIARTAKSLGSVEAAEKWYRGHHLAELGGRTPAQMVRAGELKALLEHLSKEAADKA